ncbi:MAG: MBL fold metallo-hydrolase [Anaerolineales bacterium]|nr:MBL fold metallo-hydrolase [Anaerolineales bacterium]
MLQLKKLVVGSWAVNCYLVVDEATNRAVLIDPGEEADKILAWVEHVDVERILLTHGHFDHVGALEAVREALDVPVGIHPADQVHFGLDADFDLKHGDIIPVGVSHLQVVFIPGHTPGSVAFILAEEEGFSWVVVGDAIFPGGPGKTVDNAALQTLLDALQREVFVWEDIVQLYPGHGDATTVGVERPDFEAFVAKDLPPELFGDVSWR